MRPVLFHLGDWGLRSYGVFTIAGYLTGAFYLWTQRRRAGLQTRHVVDLTMAAVAGGLLGGKLGGALYAPAQYVGWERLFHGGLSYYQGMWGSLLAGWLYCRLAGLNVPAILDALAIGTPLGSAVGRIGCFLNGCCYGTVTSVPWAVMWAGDPRHPSQLYEAAADLVIAACLHRAAAGDEAGRRRPAGALFCAYLVAYGAARFAVELFRGDEAALGGLTLAQWISLVTAVCGAVAWRRLALRRAAQTSETLR